MRRDREILLGRRFEYDPNFKDYLTGEYARRSQSRINKRISRGIYEFEECKCFCGNNDDALLATKDRYNNYYPIVICKHCGLIRANPRLNKESSEDFYKNEYRALYGDYEIGKERIFKLKLKQGEKVLNYVSRNIELSKGTVVFDIGCNMGAGLVSFSEKGWEVYGVDYDKDFIEYGKSKTGFNLFVGGVERLEGIGKKADLIILNHVIEHFLDLDYELRKIKKVLQPSGYVYIACPGTFWWIRNICQGNILGVLQNAHTWQFSLETLMYVMECLGFKMIFGDEGIEAIFQNGKNNFRNRRDIPGRQYEKTVRYFDRLEMMYLPRYFLKKLFKIFL